MRRNAVLGLALAVGVGGAGCNKSRSGEIIPLGALLSLTGNLASSGSEQLEAAALAVSEINHAGGVLGAQLTLISKDDGTDVERGRAAAQALINAHVPVIIGSDDSAITLAVAELTQGEQVAVLSPSATATQLTHLGDQGWVNRTCGSDALQAKLLAKRARAQGFSKVAIIRSPDDYGTGMAQAFAKAFHDIGGNVTLEVAYAKDAASYVPLLTPVFETNPEAVLLIAYPVEGARVMTDWLSSGFKQTYWFFSNSLEDAAFITGVGASRFNFPHEGTGPGTPIGVRYSRFQAAFRVAYAQDPTSASFSANAYDAVYLAALAMSAAGKVEGGNLHDAMVAVSAVGKIVGPENFAEARTAAEAGTDIDYEGASGSVDMNQSGDVVAPYDLWMVQNGALIVTQKSISP